jgi:hypothetical protein
MTATAIRNRLDRLEESCGMGQPPIVVVLPGETDEAAFAKFGVRPGDGVRVLRVCLVSAGSAAEAEIGT